MNWVRMKTVFWVGTCAGFIWIQSAQAMPSERSLIRQQFVEYFAAQPLEDASVAGYLKTQRADGTWPDIDYESKQRGSWPTLNHLKRVLVMSQAYVRPDSRFYHQPHVLRAILAGHEHWLKEDYGNPNWWHRCIGIPQTMGRSFILLGDELPPAILQQAQLSVFKRSRIKMTGQNRVWLSGIAFMKALLAEDESLMHTAADSIWAELSVSTAEGIQPDGCFHQHGPQVQIGNYGLSYGENMIQWGSILRGTEYALSGKKLENLRMYMLHGASWFIWKEHLDLSGCGRQVDEDCQAKKARSLNRQIRQMVQIDPDYKAEYEKRLSRENQLVGHRSFWCSDLAIHRRPDWYASVKMSSTRVVGSETCNSENMLGLHLGDGVLMICLNGREYENIQPLWDWHRLPGTTCDQGMDELTPHGWNQSYGGSDFAGVLGDRDNGLAAMEYKREALTARKAWFFTRNAVVCLGAGISGKTQGPVYTSIQQSLLNGAVTKGDSWIHHAGIGYQWMEGTPAVETGKVAGNWLPIFPAWTDRPATGEVFSLWIDHGKSPDNAKYAYKIFPQVSAGAMPALVVSDALRILCNEKTQQAIESDEGVQAVFYDAGSLRIGTGDLLEVSAPCLLMLAGDQLRVCDPTHLLRSVTVTIAGQAHAITFPAEDQAGQQVLINLLSR